MHNFKKIYFQSNYLYYSNYVVLETSLTCLFKLISFVNDPCTLCIKWDDPF